MLICITLKFLPIFIEKFRNFLYILQRKKIVPNSGENMSVNHYIDEVEKYIGCFKLQIEEEKKDVIESQKKFSHLLSALSQKAPSSSIINSLFKDEEPNGLAFNKNEDKKKQLAEQRRAEYNAHLEKKEAERLSKRRNEEEKRNISPKSILESVDYEQILAKRKEEEAKFRNMNHTDVLPVLNGNISRHNLNSINKPENGPVLSRHNGINVAEINLPGSTIGAEEIRSDVSLAKEKRNFAFESESSRLLEERIAKHLEEQRRQMLLEFENELRKNNKIKEEIQNLQTPRSSARSSPKKLPIKTDDSLKIGRTGGGGEPVRDSYGNMITLRGSKNENISDYQNIMSFPSMQQQPGKDRMTLYREELQRQIDEKKRLEAIEKAKARELEDRIAQRIAEQQLKMQQEYERELQKNNKKKEEIQRQQERVRQLEEFQRKDAEARRKKLVEVKPPEPENIPSNDVLYERSQSPPIPAVRTKVLLDKAIPPTQTEVKPENVFSSLAEIRRKILQEQQKPKNDFKNSYEVMNRRTVQEVSDDDDDDILRSSFKYD